MGQIAQAAISLQKHTCTHHLVKNILGVSRLRRGGNAPFLPTGAAQSLSGKLLTQQTLFQPMPLIKQDAVADGGL